MRIAEFGMRNTLINPMAAILITGVVAATAVAAERTWTRSEILAIADAGAKRLGYDVEQMTISFDMSNSLWHAHLKAVEGIGGPLDIQKRLSGRWYLALHYSPMRMLQMAKGGDLWVFLDLRSGETIGALQDK